MKKRKASRRWDVFIPNPKAKLLDQVREVIRFRHYSVRTEQAYVQWIKQFIFFHNKRHPREMWATEIRTFLTHLAVKRNVAASTQNQAPYALERKYSSAANEWGWQYIFPAAARSRDSRIYTHVMQKPGLGVRRPLDLG